VTLIARSAAAATVALFISGALAADPEAGRAKAAVCMACHGNDGNSSDPAVPSLAGQPAQAIATQLFQFREGNRENPQMQAMSANLSNDDMNNLAAYFAGLKAAPPKHRTSAASAELGPQLTKKFNCTQCHGPALAGQQHIPRIAGQQPDYLRAQLKGFKASTRSDLDGNMTSAAQALTEKDIDVLVDYVAGLGAQ
jgi:cytochrome c553